MQQDIPVVCHIAFDVQCIRTSYGSVGTGMHPKDIKGSWADRTVQEREALFLGLWSLRGGAQVQCWVYLERSRWTFEAFWFGAHRQDEVIRAPPSPAAVSWMHRWVTFCPDHFKIRFSNFTFPSSLSVTLKASHFTTLSCSLRQTALWEQLWQRSTLCMLPATFTGSLQALSQRWACCVLNAFNSMATADLSWISHVWQVIPTGLDTVDLLMVFRIKETQCAKTSQDDPQACAFRPGFFVVRHLNQCFPNTSVR